jgi:sialate O-acetylesterase
MIHPIIPYAIQGVIWYQGESNASRAFQYGIAFPLLIQDWRRQWGQGDIPFYFCQLANFSEKKDQPEESSWAELREAQTKALALPNTGMAVLIDIGEELDIHPRDKTGVSDRLARLALARNYGREIAFEGPRYRSMTVEGDKVRVAFHQADGGLAAKPLPETYLVRSRFGETKPLIKPLPDSELQGFAICGADRKWKWAQAKIEGDTVLVWSPEVAAPQAVRYAWAGNPTCNLTSGAGLPASPFRTDDFPAQTRDRKY